MPARWPPCRGDIGPTTLGGAVGVIPKPNMNEAAIKRFMLSALAEGKKALPKCKPNPPVGCVIVKHGCVVSRGHTGEPGKDHAEAMALRSLPDDLHEYTAFVTLEPCSFANKTPSCAASLAKRNIGQVYVAMVDPDPRNNGKGIDILRNNGISVIVGIQHKGAMADLGPHLDHEDNK